MPESMEQQSYRDDGELPESCKHPGPPPAEPPLNELLSTVIFEMRIVADEDKPKHIRQAHAAKCDKRQVCPEVSTTEPGGAK